MRRSGSIRLLLACFVLSALAWDQGAAGVLRGKVTDSAGTPIPGATISIEGQPGTTLRTVRADASGAYAATDLAAGVYQVTASAPGFAPVTGSVQVTETAPTIWNAVATSSLSLSSLGFPASATQGNAAEQARLNRRARMLKIHQTLGLITTV
ncbi:MAG TPA: carboxypeptidase-like regulatory domain-containing protein, partial [Terriglobales bacterium]|nr:carboxypeptidase-like regulatory domain-containing protein [Terriglobales bacterium]